MMLIKWIDSNKLDRNEILDSDAMLKNVDMFDLYIKQRAANITLKMNKKGY